VQAGGGEKGVASRIAFSVSGEAAEKKARREERSKWAGVEMSPPGARKCVWGRWYAACRTGNAVRRGVVLQVETQKTVQPVWVVSLENKTSGRTR